MKKGFTLIEVLMTLSIIGVIAAVTLPLLNANIVKKEIETSFIKTIGLIANANVLLMNDIDVVNLDDAVGVQIGSVDNHEALKYIDSIASYLNLKSGVNSKVVNYTYYNSSSTTQTYGVGSADLYISDKGNLAMSPMNESSKYYSVYVDLNGVQKKPNELGKDVQVFCIDRSTGKVYGFGSKFGGEKRGSAATYCTSSSVSKPETCAGSIIDNGGKIIYKW